MSRITALTPCVIALILYIMFRVGNPITPKNKTVNCVLMNGGVGDHVGGSLIAINYIIKTYPWIHLLVWVPDFLLTFAKHVLPKGTSVRTYTDMKYFYNRELTSLNTTWDGRYSPMKVHQVDYAFNVLCDELVTLEKKNYLKVDSTKIDLSDLDLPKNYVAMATGYTAGVREFSAPTVNKVADYLVTKGLTPVFLGQTETKTGTKHVIKGTFNTEIDYAKGINLINKTNLLQAAAVMQGAKAMVGVDCGLIHIAGCTDVPIVAGYTTVSPELRAPIRNDKLGWNWFPVVPDEDLGCRFCQVRTNFLYGHDYTKCLYNDTLCVTQLTAEKFINELEKVL